MIADPPPHTDYDRLTQQPKTTCLNCGAVLPGRFCPDCGQKDQPLRQPAHVFIAESVSEYFGLDGRLWRSLGLLFFRPGGLTAAYLEGRRSRYLRPLRLYLTASLAFFFTVSLLDPFGGEGEAVSFPAFPADAVVRADSLEGRLAADLLALNVRSLPLRETDVSSPGDSGSGRDTAAERDSLTLLSGVVEAEEERISSFPGDSLVTVADLDPRVVAILGEPVSAIDEASAGSFIGSDWVQDLPDWVKGRLARRLESADSDATRQLLFEQYERAILRQVPTALFLVLPVFALLLKLVYLRGGGRSRRHRSAPMPASSDASVVRRLVVWIGRLRWRWRRWRHHRRARVRRLRMNRARTRPVRGAWRRTVARARSHAVLRPWRRRRLRFLRRSLRGRRTRYYAEHLVFALHVHAFTFFALIVLVLLVDVGPDDSLLVERLTTAIVLSIPLYFLVAQHRVYAESWARTLVKAVGVGILYTLVVSGGTFIAAALALRFG